MTLTGRDFRTYHRKHHVAATRETLEKDTEKRRATRRALAAQQEVNEKDNLAREIRLVAARPKVKAKTSFISRALRFVTRRRS